MLLYHIETHYLVLTSGVGLTPATVAMRFNIASLINKLMQYCQPFHIPILEQIQQEFLNYLDGKLSPTVRGIVINKSELHNFPILLNYIQSLTKLELLDKRPLKFFVNHPYQETRPHVDTRQPPIALNIPILNTKKTEFYYCQTDQSNLTSFYGNGNGHTESIICKDITKIIKLESTELTMPHLVRTDILHGVENNNPTMRIIASLRWHNWKKDFENCFL